MWNEIANKPEDVHINSMNIRLVFQHVKNWFFAAKKEFPSKRNNKRHDWTNAFKLHHVIASNVERKMNKKTIAMWLRLPSDNSYEERACYISFDENSLTIDLASLTGESKRSESLASMVFERWWDDDMTRLSISRFRLRRGWRPSPDSLSIKSIELKTSWLHTKLTVADKDSKKRNEKDRKKNQMNRVNTHLFRWNSWKLSN